MTYRRCGYCRLKLPARLLGLWHSFGDVDRLANSHAILRNTLNEQRIRPKLAIEFCPFGLVSAYFCRDDK
jgi:hypothetical protein